MATKPGPILALGGLAALMLLRKESVVGAKHKDSDLDGTPHEGEDEPPVAEEDSYEDLIAEWEDPLGQPRIGRFYQVKNGDTLLTISREALFGNREPRREPRERQAVVELSIRIDCSPWNQATAGRARDEISSGHYAVEEGWTPLGVAFFPVHADNRTRMSKGVGPSVGGGKSLPYIWIPQIDLDALEQRGEVTTFGQNWDDDGKGSYSMIDPPPWVIDLGFDDVVGDMEVGCNLPEGDYRSVIGD
jgi:hypothetical protein